MPTVNINRKVMEKIIGKKLTTEQLKDRISMLGTDLESITDDEIIVEIFPNRPDMLSEQGFGRALSSFLGVKTGLRNYDIKKSDEKVYVAKGMEKVRPFTVCAIAKNLELDDEKIRELIQVQEKLHITFCRKRKKAAIGMYPLEKIKTPIHFTAKKPEEIVFRPLEWHKEINANQILENHPTGIEYRHLVKGLSKYAIFHDANDEILSFTPIINSHKTGKITDSTKEAFIEVSGFDLNVCSYVLNILVAAITDMGADIYSMEVVYPDKKIVTPNFTPKKMHLDLSFINKWLGLDLKQKEVKLLLEKMGYGYEKGTVLIPAYRPDILHMVDLAEDIAISYGYENFKPEIPSKATVGGEDEFEKLKKKVSHILAGLGMLETSSYHLSNEKVQFTKMRTKANDSVKLANSLSEDFDLMRYSLLAGLMQILSENTHNEYPQNLFEIGSVFKLGKTETGVVEPRKLAGIICESECNYTKIRQVVDYLLKNLDIKYEIKESNHESFITGRAGDIVIDGKKIGSLGELHPQVLSNFGVEMPASGFEIDMDPIFNAVLKKI
ncbi:MAG: phenylalanine--tRNA ligase subunit beta [archaeon]